MKKQIFKYAALVTLFAALLLLATGTSSCRRMSHNGDLDGQWKVTEIYFTETGSSVNPPSTFIDINLELLQIRGDYGYVTGVISYHKGGSQLTVDFKGAGKTTLGKMGITADPITMHIDRLDSKWMVLSTTESTITCRRF